MRGGASRRLLQRHHRGEEIVVDGVHLEQVVALVEGQVAFGESVIEQRLPGRIEAGADPQHGGEKMQLEAPGAGMSHHPQLRKQRRRGGTQRPEVEYIVFPGSGNGRPLHSNAHEDLGRHYLGKAYRNTKRT